MLFKVISHHIPVSAKKHKKKNIKSPIWVGIRVEYTPQKTAIELGKFFFFPIRMTGYPIFRYKKAYIQVWVGSVFESVGIVSYNNIS